ncbi:MAG: CDP-diacylglycerol--glycerol-3-phosphate 3-phosphatidyltransferase [Gammaproteobacteria bacterium]|nr:CDP-diacylglycerol--glycerol-3-phosphate 3-phosphatidyltransferase [Gammaproteobacteria bacterium]
MWNLPNLLTLFRIAVIPVIVVVFYLPVMWAGEAAAWLFLAATITDFFDGWLARRWGQESPLGAFLDPVADKLLVGVVLVLLVQSDPSIWVAVAAAIIIGREITISALREWMAELGKRAAVAVSYVGKIKTTAQMSSLVLMLYSDPIAGLPTYTIGFYLLYAAAVLTLWSMIIYLRAAMPVLLGSYESGVDDA